MKKSILSTLVLAALTFASCKKDNLQPTTTTNIEQLNSETSSDEDKAVDARNKFVGNWSGGTGLGQPFFLKITKTTNNRLKIVQTYGFGSTIGNNGTFYAKVIGNKLSFYGTENSNGVNVERTGTKPTTSSNKLKLKVVEKYSFSSTPTTTYINYVKQ